MPQTDMPPLAPNKISDNGEPPAPGELARLFTNLAYLCTHDLSAIIQEMKMAQETAHELIGELQAGQAALIADDAAQKATVEAQKATVEVQQKEIDALQATIDTMNDPNSPNRISDADLAALSSLRDALTPAPPAAGPAPVVPAADPVTETPAAPAPLPVVAASDIAG